MPPSNRWFLFLNIDIGDMKHRGWFFLLQTDLFQLNEAKRTIPGASKTYTVV